ncbi:hypothetical protein L2750_12795 [Shewanella submarina]|uniref:Structural protein P5 n=1 Tax=Shewanella submarina TaxID=2016376 RepID=A0ABV7GIU3_9GAMM|nr:hypothetical protein [Shewanella submarina]MCL1038027.1 hypothetical protein [Shewanella submarina]
MNLAAKLVTGSVILGGMIFWALKKPHPKPGKTSSPNPADFQLTPWAFVDFDGYLPTGGNSMVKPYNRNDGKPIPKGIRNNNPLNIEAGQPWQGANGSDGRFATFESAWFGIRAAGRLLKTYRDRYGLNTVSGIVNRWAPPSDNNPTDNYIRYVADKAGVDINQPLADSDYPHVVTAMIEFENGYNPYEANEIANAVAAGLA